MKYIFKSVFILLLVFCNSQLNAQNSTLDFTLSSESVSIDGQNFTASSSIVKIGDILTWTQTKGEVSETLSFMVTESSGNWDETTSQGSIIYTMTFEDFQCGFTLSNQGSNLTAILTFSKNGVEEERYTFDVNAISYQ